MISIKKIRADKEFCKSKLALKQDNTDIDRLLLLDKKARELKTSSSQLREKRNKATEIIGVAKKTGKDVSDAINETRLLGSKLKQLENELNQVSKTLEEYLFQMPNFPHDSVPTGKDSTGNVIIRTFGDKPEFSFTPKTHIDLGEKLRLFDFQRGAKLSGSGFPIYTGEGAKLERALINTMLDYHQNNFGFLELFPPVLMNKQSMQTTGQLPKFEEDMYHTEIDNLYLAPTAEVPVTNYHRNEIIDESNLPINYVAYSPCFRRESGSYGKDTRGLLRIHQFNKVELVKFTTPQSSYDELETLTKQAESVLKKLGLHYRVIELCTGDLSFSASKCYDLEIWAPGEKKWLEVSSCSNFESFQARRGNIRYRRSNDQQVDYLHTLNGSGVATPRLMVALLETYQTEQGNILFPSHVADYLGVKEIA